MSEQSRVFIGLLRPPKLMGLPIMYAMVWLFGSTLLFLWVQSGVVAWPALWKAADWDPNFLDVLVITLQETPPTTNRKLHGGDSYAP